MYTEIDREERTVRLLGVEVEELREVEVEALYQGDRRNSERMRRLAGSKRWEQIAAGVLLERLRREELADRPEII